MLSVWTVGVSGVEEHRVLTFFVIVILTYATAPVLKYSNR